MPSTSRRSFSDQIVWMLGSVLTLSYRGGPFWFWGQKWREERFIHRLLIAYPGLTQRRTTELYEVATRVLDNVGAWKVAAAAASASVAAMLLTTPIMIAMRSVGVPLPRWSKLLLVCIAAAIAWEGVRRWCIGRQLDRIVASVFPTMFCTCGYCLAGLPAGSVCPECGVEAARPSLCTTQAGIASPEAIAT